MHGIQSLPGLWSASTLLRILTVHSKKGFCTHCLFRTFRFVTLGHGRKETSPTEYVTEYVKTSAKRPENTYVTNGFFSLGIHDAFEGNERWRA
ncbi:hypothetical protein TNIN_261051 [Trichonephila inaurata madagascariensis]|uniref:Uncharacterized protein n=1 Tax=Trichonephila inaurata madagascariensis TaxID=2747483 RepID=A0A8X6ICX7_9ARAC|nr:hypothetical protein TNIN_435741 [Trichonephila inaurata madagascariensis]GFY72322.1 hypothetical protein TNIN_261051 [Trichonephila inaurata madagascariensis]